MEKGKKKRWMTLLRVAITAGTLGFLFWQVVSLDRVVAELGRANGWILLAAFGLFLLSLIIRAYRWFVLLRALHPQVPFSRLLHLYFVGQFFSSFLPSQFGGDVMRALELTRDTDSPAAVGTVLLDRMTGLMVLAAVGLVALPFQAARLEPWLTGTMLVVTVGVLVGGGLVLEGRFLRWITARLPWGLSLAGDGALARIYAAVTGCGWPAVWSALAVSLVFNVLNVFIGWLCGQAIGIGISLGYFFAVTPLLSISGLVPSIGGWGVREAVSAAVFGGTSAEKATAVGASIGLITFAAGLVGGIVYGVEMVRSFRRGEGEGEDERG